MARALIVGCGCRGLALARVLRGEGWLVRGTTRDPDRLAEIESAQVEAALADPDRLVTILDEIADITAVFWLLGSAGGGDEAVRALHSERLESMLARLVDTPVRRFVYEAAGSVDPAALAHGAELVRQAAERWRMTVAVVDAEPSDRERWLDAMRTAIGGY